MMDEVFDAAGRLTKEQLTPLLARDDRALWRFVVQFALYVGSGGVILWAGGRWWWLLALAYVVFGWMTMAMFAITHETSHNTAFSSRWMNEVVLWLASIPSFYTPTGFRQFHFAHHRHTHDPHRDPEISVGGNPAPAVTGSLGMYLSFLSGIPLLLFKVMLLVAAAMGGPSVVWKRILFFVPERHQRRFSWEARGALLFHALFWGLGFVYLPTMVYLLGAVLFGHLMLALYLVTEHNGLPHDASIFGRTRTTRAKGWMRFVMWNMPYHTEHHAYPAIPWHALPQAHTILKEHLQILPNYRTFHRRVIGSLLRGQPYREEPKSQD